MRHFKEQKAEETAKEMLEDKIWRLKEKNETKANRVAQKKLYIEAQNELKSKTLADKEKRQMSCL